MGLPEQNKRHCGLRVPKVAVRRQKVAEAARALFCEHGFHATGMAELSSRSGIKVGQIYRDFAGKEAIVAEIVRGDLATFLDTATLDAAIARQDGGAVRGWLHGLVRREKDPGERRLFPEILAEAARNDTVAHLFRSAEETIRAAIAIALEALAPGDAKAERRRRLANLLLTLMMGTSHRLTLVREDEVAAVLDSCTDLIDRELDALSA